VENATSASPASGRDQKYWNDPVRWKKTGISENHEVPEPQLIFRFLVNPKIERDAGLAELIPPVLKERRLKIIFKMISVLLLTATSLLAGQKLSVPEMEEMESRIEQRQALTKTLQADFTQSVLPLDEKTPIVSRGVLYYQNPQNLRIDYQDPVGEGLLLTPTQTIQWKKEGSQRLEEVDPTRPSFRRIILDVLERKPSLWSYSFQREMSRAEKSIFVQLTPLESTSRLPDRVQVELRASDLQIRRIEVQMKEFQWSLLFSKIQVNTPIPPRHFQRPPVRDKR
jgi:outer membrane lipoprotein-sorting protein